MNDIINLQKHLLERMSSFPHLVEIYLELERYRDIIFSDGEWIMKSSATLNNSKKIILI